MSLSALTQPLDTNCTHRYCKYTFSYYLHLPLQTLRCAHVLPEIFLQSQLNCCCCHCLCLCSLLVLISLIVSVHTLHFVTPSVTPSFRLILHPHCHSFFITPHFTPSVVTSSPLMCWFLVRGLSTHYFSSQLGMTWSSHINLIGKLEKRSCYKHSREDTNDFGAQTV